MKKINIFFLVCMSSAAIIGMDTGTPKRKSQRLSSFIRTLRKSTSFTTFTEKKSQKNSSSGSITPETIAQWRKESKLKYSMPQDSELIEETQERWEQIMSKNSYYRRLHS